MKSKIPNWYNNELPVQHTHWARSSRGINEHDVQCNRRKRRQEISNMLRRMLVTFMKGASTKSPAQSQPHSRYRNFNNKSEFFTAVLVPVLPFLAIVREHCLAIARFYIFMIAHFYRVPLSRSHQRYIFWTKCWIKLKWNEMMRN